MPAPLVKTKTPGVYKRGSRYVVLFRDHEGRQRQQSARTYDDARRLKSARQAAVAEGSYQAASRVRLAEYALEWVGRYQGRGRRGFREQTREDYRRDLKRYVLPYLDHRLRRTLEQITPRDVANFVAWLCDPTTQGEHHAEERRERLRRDGAHEAAAKVVAEPVVLADATVRRILSSLRSCLGTAMAEGLIRTNPTAGAALPARDEQQRIDTGDDEEECVRALTLEQLVTLLELSPPRHATMFRLLAATGLRISEAIALRWSDMQLDGAELHVRVRRAYVRGRYGPPKSRHGRRGVPIDHELVSELRQRRAATEWPRDEDLVFPAMNGKPLAQGNLRRRVLKPVGEEAGVPWIGFHTFRHTCATRLFAAGRNAVQVQRWLGHHSPAFTLSTYVHLLDGDLGEPLSPPPSMHASSPSVPVGV